MSVTAMDYGLYAMYLGTDVYVAKEQGTKCKKQWLVDGIRQDRFWNGSRV